MKLTFFQHSPLRAGINVCLLFLIWLLTLNVAWAETATDKTEFPATGLTEVIPKSTAVAARITEANALLSKTDALTEAYDSLAMQEQQLQELEEQFADWEDTTNWPLNRLMSADARYKGINQQQEKILGTLSDRLSMMEELRKTWTAEKEYWQDWKKALQSSDIKIPEETFQKTRQGIDDLLQRVAKASTEIVNKQEEYAGAQELLTSRLTLINKTLDELRQSTFRRNTYSLFSKDFYRQLTPELFARYRENLSSTLQLPDGFWQRHGWVAILQLVCIAALAVLLMHRSRQTKPTSRDWRFLFKHPIAGALFIALATTGSFYDNIPPFWGWLVLAVATISGAILVGSMAENERRKRLVRALAMVFLVSETLKMSGLPTPAYQFYVVILCAVAAPACLLLARHRQRQNPGHFGIYSASLYLISLFAVIGLVTALLGFVNLSTHLVDAVLGTIIIAFMVRIAMHLADGGIAEFLRLNWVRNRQLTLRLGISTAGRLKNLAHIVILVNAGLFLLVMWGVYNNVDEAITSILNIEYTIGEFSISVFMVAMLCLVLYLANLLSWLLQGLADAHYMSPRKMDIGVKTAMKRLLHYAIFTVGFFVAVSMAGLELQKLTIIAGALSVGIGFGLQNIVNNFVSGLILLFERPVKVGDTINIDEQWGTITKIGLRSTVFETLDRAEIIVPNSDLISQKVVNWTFTTNISRVVLTVGVAYGSPLDKVLEILQQVAKEHPDILEDPESSAIFTGFGDSSIDFELRAWISDIGKRLKVKSELGQAVDRYFREEGITIPFPQRDLHLRSIESNLQGILKPTKPAADE